MEKIKYIAPECNIISVGYSVCILSGSGPIGDIPDPVIESAPELSDFMIDEQELPIE